MQASVNNSGFPRPISLSCSTKSVIQNSVSCIAQALLKLFAHGRVKSVGAFLMVRMLEHRGTSRERALGRGHSRRVASLARCLG